MVPIPAGANGEESAQTEHSQNDEGFAMTNAPRPAGFTSHDGLQAVCLTVCLSVALSAADDAAEPSPDGAALLVVVAPHAAGAAPESPATTMASARVIDRARS